MQLYESVYAEVNFICIFILLYIRHHLENSIDQQAENIALRRVITAVLSILIIDCFWILTNGKETTFALATGKYITSLFLCFAGIIAYLWLNYVEVKLKLAGTRKKRYWILLAIPLMLLFPMAFLSPWTRWMYYYDAANAYHRGSLFFLQTILPLFYSLYSAFEILRSAKRCKTRQDREEVLTLLSFLILPFFGFLLTLLNTGVPLLWPMCAISLLLIFVNFQNYKISTDSLTGVNNRRQFDKQLSILTDNLEKDQCVCLLLLDIDLFKTVNDTLGHYEGDHALAETAGILKKICGEKNLFLARYGGDEFAILSLSRGDEDGIDSLKKSISSAFEQRNKALKISYPLRISMGAGKCGIGHCDSIPSLITAADQELYQEKRRKSGKLENSHLQIHL